MIKEVKINIPEILEYLEFSKILGQTLVCSYGPFPRKGGNCFDVKASNGKSYNILNFNVENLDELLKTQKISYPIKIGVMDESRAVIIDSRISPEWYSDFCSVCCPREMLPLDRRILIKLKEDSGKQKSFIDEVTGMGWTTFEL